MKATKKLGREIKRAIASLLLSLAFKITPKQDYQTMKWFASQPFE